MKRHLNIAVFAPQSSLDEGYRDLIKDSFRFNDPEIETGIHFVEDIDSLRSHNFSWALFHDDWYENYGEQDVRAILNQLTYSFWHGELTPNFSPKISEIIGFLRTENGNSEADNRFFKSLGNLSKILRA